MPELPEVELAAVWLRSSLVGRSLEDVADHTPPNRANADVAALVAARPRMLSAVRRHGKQLALDFDTGHTLLLHLGMTGRFAHRPSGDVPAHVRFSMRASKGPWVDFVDVRRFGRFTWLPTPDAATHPAWASLGPDALEAAPADWCSALSRRGPVKTALLDQARLAGIGNIYANEGLFLAGIDPRRQAASLTTGEVEQLASAIVATMRGTLSREAGVAMRYLSEGHVENPFAVYGRAGEPCPRCGAPVQRIIQAGRSTFLCPPCQPPEPAAAGPQRATSRTGSRGP